MDLDGVTLDRLRSFEVFSRHLNFTSAAEELHISQPSLHVKISNLSQAFGATLYQRHGRTLVVTELGWEVARCAHTLSQQIEGLSRQLGRPTPEPLILVAGSGAHRFVIADAVRHMTSSGRRLRLLTENSEGALRLVRDGDATVGVSVVHRALKGLRVTAIATYPQVAIIPTSHPLARRRSLTFSDVASSDLIAPPPGRPQRVQLEKLAKSSGLALRVVAEGEGWSQLVNFAQLGVGICIVNGCVATEGEIVSRVIEDLAPVTYSAFCLASRSRDAAVVALIDALQATAP